MDKLRSVTFVLCFTVAFALALAPPVGAQAAPGDLDATFCTGGKVTTDFAGDSDHARAVAIQTDGKIVAAGKATNSRRGGEDFALARYNPDGTLDTTFGTGGRVTTDFAGDADEAFAVVLQADGKIVAAGKATAGYRGEDFALARYNPNGTLDTTFGTGGKVTTDFAGDADQAFALVLQTDGKIVAAGEANAGYRGEDCALARYSPNGTLDTTLVVGGKVTTDFAGNTDRAFGVALQTDGRIVAAGEATAGYRGEDFALARYNSNGTLDTTFGTGGKVITDFAGDTDRAFAVAVQTDGRIVAAGETTTSYRGEDFALARYNPNGALDATFGEGGQVTTDFAGDTDRAFALALQTDGKIVAAGEAKTQTKEDFALARYLR